MGYSSIREKPEVAETPLGMLSDDFLFCVQGVTFHRDSEFDATVHLSRFDASFAKELSKLADWWETTSTPDVVFYGDNATIGIGVTFEEEEE